MKSYSAVKVTFHLVRHFIINLANIIQLTLNCVAPFLPDFPKIFWLDLYVFLYIERIVFVNYASLDAIICDLILLLTLNASLRVCCNEFLVVLFHCLDF